MTVSRPGCGPCSVHLGHTRPTPAPGKFSPARGWELPPRLYMARAIAAWSIFFLFLYFLKIFFIEIYFWFHNLQFYTPTAGAAGLLLPPCRAVGTYM